VLVFNHTHSAAATTGLFVAAQFVPALIAPILTARLDQSAIRRVLPLLYGLEAALFAGLAVLASRFALGLVYAAVLADGVLMLSARAITRSAVSKLLTPSGLLREGNGLLNIGLAVAGVAGVASGGELVGAFGPGTVLAIDAGSFALVALISATIPARQWSNASEADLITRIREGLSWARSHPTIRLLIGGEALAIVFFTLIVPIEVVYAKATLGATDAGYGLFLASWSLGQVGGGVLYAVTRSASPWATVMLSTLLMGLAYLGMALTDRLAVACAFALVGGVGNGIQWVAVVTLVQEWTPAELQARISGLLESAASMATGAGFLIGGALASLFSAPTAFAIAGGGVVTMVLVALPFRRLLPGPMRPAPEAPSDPARATR
jgi:predicted MFS family arabinose efflux permease